ncbi:MAG TPA: Cof-type HAD-IIB family hydrolase [Erysipelotrichaceae bacterium]|nr:Cof-type HAD-IIB family hydrolase [Erysipelotrichaceae bacterium]
MPKLIFLDIDGTLTEPGSNVPPASALEAVRRSREKGNLVYLCTGRNMGMLEPVLKYGFDGAVALGGGYIKAGDEVIYDHPMTKEQFDTAMDVLKRNEVFRTIEAKDVTYGDEDLGDFLKDAEGGNSEIERWRKALSQDLGIRPMSEYDGRDIYKIVIMCTEASQLEEPRQLLEKDFLFAIQDVTAHHCLNGDLVNRAFDKGQAIKRVCSHLGIPIEETYGFGDSMNDLEMIETVGTSVCMENGSAKLKEISDVIAPSVADDGLFKAFEQLGLF